MKLELPTTTSLTTFPGASAASPCPLPSSSTPASPAFPCHLGAPPSYVGLVPASLVSSLLPSKAPTLPPDALCPSKASTLPPDALCQDPVPSKASPPPGELSLCPDLLRLDADEDSISLDLTSLGSRSRSPSLGSTSTALGRRVTFAETLVTAVHTRPFTPEGDKRLLYYTPSETDAFRRAYREERQASPLASGDREPPSSEATGRHRISRVVVEYGEGRETFYDPDDYPPTGESPNGVFLGDSFFDNDSFWSGAISWY